MKCCAAHLHDACNEQASNVFPRILHSLETYLGLCCSKPYSPPAGPSGKTQIRTSIRRSYAANSFQPPDRTQTVLCPQACICSLQPACAQPVKAVSTDVCRKMPFSTTFHGLAVTLPFGLFLKCACICCPARLCLAGVGALVSSVLRLMSHLQATRCLPGLAGTQQATQTSYLLFAPLKHACVAVCHGHLFPLATM